MICTSIANIDFKELQTLISEFEMLELRLDLLDYSDLEYQKIYKLGKPIIATYRYGNTDDSIRTEALQKAISLGANYIDIEIDADPLFIDTMILFARKNKCKIIISYHNNELTPSMEKLNLLIEKSKTLKPDYVKLACKANSKKDVARILALYQNHQQLIAFNMGEKGKISRLASLYLGADFTYAAVSKNKSTAEGQLTNRELKIITKEINK